MKSLSDFEEERFLKGKELFENGTSLKNKYASKSHDHLGHWLQTENLILQGTNYDSGAEYWIRMGTGSHVIRRFSGGTGVYFGSAVGSDRESAFFVDDENQRMCIINGIVLEVRTGPLNNDQDADYSVDFAPIYSRYQVKGAGGSGSTVRLTGAGVNGQEVTFTKITKFTTQKVFIEYGNFANSQTFTVEVTSGSSKRFMYDSGYGGWTIIS